ncbi:MAG: PDZ domain-containing protein [Sedimentisphaerales bacterium]|nr:PDZ domain-containing protein [Sedimentisphaerales bacterium]
MGYWLRKNWLIVITIISLTLNIVAAFFLYQGSKIIVDSHEKNLIKAEPLDYDTFKEQWGNAWLGLEVSEVTPEIAAAIRLNQVQGALVKSVAPGSPADKANIAPGDVIVSFNGRKIRTAQQLQGDLLGSEIGGEVYMCVVKGDYTITVYAVPIERPSYLQPVTKALPWLGAEVSEVLFGSDQAQKLEEVGKAGGILVEEVVRNSPAEKAGLQADDIIMSFNSRKTRTLREFLSDLAGSEPGDEIPMCIIRDDIRKTIYVTLEENPRFQEI